LAARSSLFVFFYVCVSKKQALFALTATEKGITTTTMTDKQDLNKILFTCFSHRLFRGLRGQVNNYAKILKPVN
jgi:hypothetical protein